MTPAVTHASKERSGHDEFPPLVAPIHGHGKLCRGGVPGHRGGGGKPPDRLRRALLRIARIGVARVLKPLIDGQPVRVIDRDGSVVEIDPTPADQLRAVEIALKYGLGTADKVKVNAAVEGLARVETVRLPVIKLPELGSDWSGVEFPLAESRGPGGRKLRDKLRAAGPKWRHTPARQ